jgi:hypothetical protein
MHARPARRNVPALRRSLPWAVVGLVGVLAAGACAGGRPEPPRHPRKSLLASAEVTPAYPSPATWRYHPKKEAPLRVRRKLSAHETLYAGDRGERWLVDTHDHSVRAAARLAPEALVAILKLDNGGWLFVGQSGTTYEADKPLGAFIRSSAPLDPLARVSAAAGALLGVRRDGVLVQSSDAGASWHIVGPGHARFSDVALDDKGRGLALAVPERLYTTRDRGASWKPLDQKTFGALSIERRPDDSIALSSVFGTREWKPDAAKPFVELASHPRGQSNYKLPLPPPRGPDASALSEGRAAIVGEQYLELDHEGDSWQLLSGPVDGQLEAHPLPEAKGCRAVRIAGFSHWLYLACSRSSLGRTSRPITLMRSKDSGKRWTKEDFPVVGSMDDFRIAVGVGGALLVSGVCPPRAAGSGCGVQGVYYRRRAEQDGGAPAGGSDHADAKAKPAAQTDYELAPAATPALKASADALAFSSDGRTAYAIGRRTKNGAFTVFVSHNSGHSFEAHEIDQLPADYDDSYYGGYRRYGHDSGTQVESVMAAEDGTLAMVVSRYGTTTLLVTDDEGRVVSLSHAPSSQAAIGAAGTRALAVTPGTRDAWESLDGGATWDPIGELPLDLCGRASRCKVPVYCYPGGCVIGDQLSRIGWHGQADPDEGVLAPPAPAPPAAYDAALREPISCTLDPAPWKAIDGLRKAPDAAQAELGKAVWFALVEDPGHAAAWMIHATGGAHPRLEKVTLLPPVRRPGAVAMKASHQVEGGAALRYDVPDGVHETNLGHLEVAWDNLFEGRVVHARLADGGGYVPGDYASLGSGRSQLARPALLSIASGGLYLRLHGSRGDAQKTLFLDGHAVTGIPPVSWPDAVQSVRSEMVHAGRTHLPIKIGVALTRALRAAGGYQFDAMTTSLVDPAAFGLDQDIGLTYLGGRAGLVVTLEDRHGGQHRSQLFIFRNSGAVLDPPVALSMQQDLPDRPSRCSTMQRTSTARSIQRSVAGTRHPVIVSDASEPLRALLTRFAVMYGTPSSPCVAAYDADAVKLEGGEVHGEHAILPIDDLDHAWLFRTAPGSSDGRIEYRVMKCRFDTGAEVPPELYRAAAGAPTAVGASVRMAH